MKRKISTETNDLDSAETSKKKTNSTSDPLIEIDPCLALYPQYRVSGFASRGGFGAVYLATDVEHREYAIKVQKCVEGQPILYHEMTVSKVIMSNCRPGSLLYGVPKFFNYMKQYGHEFLVMQRLGQSLKDKVDASPTNTLSKKSTLMVGIQVVRILQMLHENLVLHRDIKPGNLMTGRGAEEDVVNIIDFGLSTIVQDYDQHDPEGMSLFVGTVAYAPAEALFEKQPTRAGDLQSLAYCLVDLATGFLPWKYFDEDNRELTHTELGTQRQNIEGTRLCEDFPELTGFVMLVFGIKGNSAPDYEMLVKELLIALNRIGCSNDGSFDWITKENVMVDYQQIEVSADRQTESLPETLRLVQPFEKLHLSRFDFGLNADKEDKTDQLFKMEEEILGTHLLDDVDVFSNVKCLPQEADRPSKLPRRDRKRRRRFTKHSKKKLSRVKKV